MKLLLSFFLFGLITSASAHSQQSLKPKSAEEVIDALCHTWIPTNLESMNTRLPLPAKNDFTVLTLKYDGTFVRVTNGEEIQGKWTYRPKVMLLELEDRSGKKAYMLANISNTEMKYKIDQKPPVEYIILKKAE